MQQWIERNPVTASPRPETAARIPYLFDLDTAKQLLAVARSFPERSRARYRGLVYETIFALLYGLGLRVGEVVRLTLADVDFTRDLLLIRESKFQKTRIVPLGPNLARRLKHYVEERHGCNPAPEACRYRQDRHVRIGERRTGDHRLWMATTEQGLTHRAQARGRNWAHSRLLGAFDACDLYHDGAGEQRNTRRGAARGAGHAEPGTTKLYDRRGYNPEKSASFFATY